MPARATSRSCCPFRSPRAGSSSRSLCSTSKSRWRSSTRTSTGDRHLEESPAKPSLVSALQIRLLGKSFGRLEGASDRGAQTLPSSLGLRVGAATCLEKSEKRGVQAARNGPSEVRKGHPLCGTNVSLNKIHFHRYWTGVRFRLVEVSEVSARLKAPVGLPILCHK